MRATPRLYLGLLAGTYLLVGCTLSVSPPPGVLPSTLPSSAPSGGASSSPSPLPSTSFLGYDTSPTAVVIELDERGGNIATATSTLTDVYGDGHWVRTVTPLFPTGSTSPSTVTGILAPGTLDQLVTLAQTKGDDGGPAFVALPVRAGGPPIGDVGGTPLTVNLTDGSHHVESSDATSFTREVHAVQAATAAGSPVPASPTPSATPTVAPTASPTVAPTATPTATPTPDASATATASPSATPTATATP